MKRIFVLMALVLGLCIAHDAHAQNLTVKITQRNGTSTTVSGKASLQAALTGYTLNQVKALEISAGNFVTADWTWLKTNCNNISALQDFTITAGVSSVADIPDMVTGSYFYSLSLKTLNVAKVAKIGKSASRFCTALTTATFPQATSIGNHAFDGCTKLSTANFPQVTSIGIYAFDGCTSLPTAAFPQATSIGNDAFNNCTSLTTATFPQATSIDVRAFYGCTKLTTATIPEATTIGNSAFRVCTSLPTANFPKATSIGDYAFDGCTSLPTANFPKATSIGDYAFKDCTKLSTATFPQATSIGQYAFKDCTKFSTLELGATPPTVANANAFTGCPAVRNLVLTDANGTALTGTALSNAVQNYQAHAGYNPADGLWYGWQLFDINLYVTITTTTGSTSTRVGMRLSDAIGDVALGTIKSLSITGRDFATADWTWLKTNRTALNALQDFTIQETIGSVADIPNTTETEPYFSRLETLNVAKVAKIGQSAFTYCDALTTATFPKATSIGNSAFNTCTSLTTATFPQATSIGDYAFQRCSSLTTASFPRATSIGDYAFAECPSLATIDFSKATSIEEGAFNTCTSLTTANFPQATSIGREAFSNCTSLATIDFPQATSIGEVAFKDCPSLATIDFPKATSIGGEAFENCTSLSTATFPKATTIGDGAFYSCTSLTTATFPKATSIGYLAFDGCTELSTLKLGATPPTVADANAFDGCPATRNLVLTDANGTALTGSALNTAVQNYRAHAGYNPADGLWYGWKFFDINLYVTITTTTGSTSTRVGMRLSDAIGDVALGTIKSLSITGRDFATADWVWLRNNRDNLNALQDFTIQGSIGSVADIPDMLAGSYFYSSSLKTLNVAKVAKIGDYAFKGCTSLTTATFPQATSIGEDAFGGCESLPAANFPQATTIGRWAFRECTSLTTADFPKATSIGDYAFGWCSELSTATIPQATTIGGMAFINCYSLTTANFPQATSIGNQAFYRCTSLTTATFPQVTSIGRAAFHSCKLTTANFPKATSIEDYTFKDCTKLSTVTFPQVTSIDTSAFDWCTALTTATFPKATSIGREAFYNCTKLSTLKLGATPPTVVNANAFEGCPAVRYLVPTNASGTALTGTALESAIQQYKADPGYNAADDRWYGWILETYTVTVDPGITHGTLTATPNNDVLYGTSVSLTATPKPGYQLKAGSMRAYKTGDENVTVAVTDGTFTMPAYDVTVTCEFEAIIYTWVQAVTAQPAGWDPMNIDSPEDLAWFISFVNGYNGCAMHPTAKGRITADLDMSAYQWVPIGSQVSILDPGRDDYYSSPIDAYEGLFDGGYHAIKGLRNLSAVVRRSGLFDNICYGTVQKVIVADCDFHVGEGGAFGIIANSISGVKEQNLNAGIQAVIAYCVAAGKLTVDNMPVSKGTTYIAGLVGDVSHNSVVHSCVAVPILEGASMGGLAVKMVCGFGFDGLGALREGVLRNCYAYPLFRNPALDDTESVFGGLVAYNEGGDVQNCYLRERMPVGEYLGVRTFHELAQSAQPGNHIRGLFAGVNRDGLISGSMTVINYDIECCYMPIEWSDMANSLIDYNVSGIPCKAPIGTGLYAPTETPYMYRHADNDASLLEGQTNQFVINTEDSWPHFLNALNAWVDVHQYEAPDGLPYAKWARTCASPVNDDYPVLLMPGANAVASDGDVLYYGDVNDLLAKELGTPDAADDAVFLYDDARLSAAAIQSTKEFYIGEGVCVLPEDLNTNVNGPAKTHVGVTFDNSATGWDWHLFSSSLTNAPLGIDYGGDNTPHQFSWDDPGVQYDFYDESVQDGFFPSMEYGAGAYYYEHWDFYTYDEPSYHFINFKRNSNSHWHQDGNHANITYANEKTLLQGKGYMMAIDQPTFMQAKGVLNNSYVSHSVSHSAEINPGYNLVGNPYQAILDFDEVAGYQGNFCHFRNNMSYTTYDADQGGYVSYVSPMGDGSSNYINGASTGAIVASRYISPLQGFFVYHPDRPTNEGIEFEPWFCKLRAEADDTYQGFRGGEEPARPTFPLVNLIATDDKGKNDILVVEFDRPENGGARKMIPIRSGKGSLYARHQDENMSIAFVEEGITEIPVRFETIEDAVFTMTSKPANGPFRYLHLIDNITGIDHDLLADSTFTFEAKASDYKSRFKLVMALEAVEEPGDDVIADQFAYYDGGTWIVEAKGDMEVYDLTGRLMLSKHLANAQNSIDLSGLSVGVYLMRVSNGSDAKMQKIVVE